MRATFLPFALPDIDETERSEIREALETGWITTGPKVQQFEAEFAAYVEPKQAIAVKLLHCLPLGCNPCLQQCTAAIICGRVYTSRALRRQVSKQR